MGLASCTYTCDADGKPIPDGATVYSVRLTVDAIELRDGAVRAIASNGSERTLCEAHALELAGDAAKHTVDAVNAVPLAGEQIAPAARPVV